MKHDDTEFHGVPIPTKVKQPGAGIGFVVHGILGENADHIVTGAKSSEVIAPSLNELGFPEIFKTFSTKHEAEAYQQGLMDMEG